MSLTAAQRLLDWMRAESFISLEFPTSTSAYAWELTGVRSPLIPARMSAEELDMVVSTLADIPTAQRDIAVLDRSGEPMDLEALVPFAHRTSWLPCVVVDPNYQYVYQRSAAA